MRAALAYALTWQKDFHVVGEAQDGHAGFEALRRLAADIVRVDIAMPGLDGVEVMSIGTQFTRLASRFVILPSSALETTWTTPSPRTGGVHSVGELMRHAAVTARCSEAARRASSEGSQPATLTKTPQTSFIRRR